MKRVIGILLSAILLVGMLSGCGAKGKLQGVWQATADLTPIMQGILQEKWPDSVYQVKDFSVVMELNFLRSGTCTIGVQESSLQKALSNMASAMKKDYIEDLKAQLTQMNKNVSLEEVLEMTGVSLNSLLMDMEKSFKEADFDRLLREQLRFDGFYEIRNDRLHISTTKEIDDYCFSFVYKIEDGVLTIPMVAGENPMNAVLTAAICPLRFQRAK